jgi:hypothetical protein
MAAEVFLHGAGRFLEKLFAPRSPGNFCLLHLEANNRRRALAAPLAAVANYRLPPFIGPSP